MDEPWGHPQKAFTEMLRSRPEVVSEWDDRQVGRRWLMLCTKRRVSENRPEEPNEFELNKITNDRVKLIAIRSRLLRYGFGVALNVASVGRQTVR